MNNALYLSEEGAFELLMAVRQRLHEIDKHKNLDLFYEKRIETLVLLSESLSEILSYYRKEKNDEKA